MTLETLPARLDAGIASGLLPGLHLVVAHRDARPLFAAYKEGEDEDWGQPLGHRRFSPTELHDLRSVTKSVVGLLYGMALDRGLVPALDTPVVEAFPEYADLVADADRRRILVRHALSMTMGLAWDESLPYTDPRNSEIAMELAPDRYRFVLDRPIVAAPGASWTYSGGAVALIGALISRGTGQSLPDFADDVLFSPLGITDFAWSAGADGVYSAASGLRLSGPDLARIGDLIVAGGELDGRRLVSEAWLEASFSRQAEAFDGLGYGLLWFLGEVNVPALKRPSRFMAGFGNGGQRLFLVPELRLSTAIFCGRYNDWGSWTTPTRIWSEMILPSLGSLHD